MAKFKWKSKEGSQSSRPLAKDDFIYDDPYGLFSDDKSGSGVPASDGEKLRSSSGISPDEWDRGPVTGDSGKGKDTKDEKAKKSDDPDARRDRAGKISAEFMDDIRLDDDKAEKDKGIGHKTRPAVELDEDLNPIRPAGKQRSHPFLRRVTLIVVTVVLLVFAGSFIFHRIVPDAPLLDQPETFLGRVLTPVQSVFSGLSDAVVGYFRNMKLRANIESEYNALRAENERLVYKAMLADELQNTLSQYQDMSDEIAANAAMEPIVCTVIGKSDGNYFSTFTINKGSNDGIEDYMAVTISGALVGYTESVQPTKSSVRTIIDSEASIAALIQSSRDQGTVRGTLGVDGTPMCRMYYLPDENLPRPGDTVITSGVGMSFPKGIPVGTVRESTRGMDSNKQYIVLEPLADFSHLEYVIVLKYKPVAEAVQGRENGRQVVDLVPLESARPSPQVPQIASSLFESQNTPDPDATPSVTPEPTETPTPSPTPTPVPTPTPEVHNLEYVPVNNHAEPTDTPTPTPEPTPTPYITPDPDTMTFEEDDG